MSVRVFQSSGREGQLQFDEEGEHWLASSDIPALKLAETLAPVTLWRFEGVRAEVVGGGMVETFAFGSDTPFSDQSGGRNPPSPPPPPASL